MENSDAECARLDAEFDRMLVDMKPYVLRLPHKSGQYATKNDMMNSQSNRRSIKCLLSSRCPLLYATRAVKRVLKHEVMISLKILNIASRGHYYLIFFLYMCIRYRNLLLFLC